LWEKSIDLVVTEEKLAEKIYAITKGAVQCSRWGDVVVEMLVSVVMVNDITRGLLITRQICDNNLSYKITVQINTRSVIGWLC
jgi:hypothetical protein